MKRITFIIFILTILINISFLLSLKFGFWNSFFYDTSPHMQGQGCDFFVFYSAAKFMQEGKNIYTLNLHPSVPYATGPFIYLPYLILLLGIPLSFFSPWGAYYLWVALSEGLLLLCSWMTYQTARKLQYPYPWLGAALWLAFTPVYLDFYLGHVELIIGLFLMLIIWGETHGQKFLSYGGWTFAFLVKIFFLPFAFVFLRQRKTLWVILTLGLAVLPFIYLFFFQPELFRKFLQPRLQRIGQGAAGAPSLMVLLDLWTLPVIVLFLVKFFILSLTLLLTLAKEVKPIDNWSLWMASFLLTYGYVWEHYYLMLLPFLAYYLLKQEGPWLWGVYVLLALPTPYIFYQQRQIYDPLYYLSKVAPLTAFYILVLTKHLRAPKKWLYFDGLLQRR